MIFLYEEKQYRRNIIYDDLSMSLSIMRAEESSFSTSNKHEHDTYNRVGLNEKSFHAQLLFQALQDMDSVQDGSLQKQIHIIRLSLCPIQSLRWMAISSQVLHANILRTSVCERAKVWKTDDWSLILHAWHKTRRIFQLCAQTHQG